MSLVAHLAGTATTLARCWKLTRLDGTVLGFTDHDQPLSFDGVTYEPRTGFTASQFASESGLAIDDQDISGALSSDRISEADIQNGLYDGALIEFFFVNWRNVAEREAIQTYRLGPVTTTPGEITATLDGLATRAQEEKALILSRGACGRRFGDALCGIDLNNPAYRATGSVTELSTDRSFNVSGVGFVSGWSTNGRLIWQTGANAGQDVPVADQTRQTVGGVSVVAIILAQVPVNPVAIGDSFTLVAGCDLTFEKCGVFGNRRAFLGAPHMPPDARVVEGYPTESRAVNPADTLANITYPVSKLGRFDE